MGQKEHKQGSSWDRKNTNKVHHGTERTQTREEEYLHAQCNNKLFVVSCNFKFSSAQFPPDR